MTTTHTPGPWGSSGTAGHETHGQYAVYHLGTGKDIAIVYDGQAHAHLIAAAPELLAALEHCLCYLEADADDEQEQRDYAAAKAAIAKAKGQT